MIKEKVFMRIRSYLNKYVFLLLPMVAACFLLLPGDVRYYISDNSVLNSIACDALKTQPYFVFTGVIVQYITYILYSLSENINWFALLLAISVTWSFCTLNSVAVALLKEKSKTLQWFILTVLFFANVFFIMHLDYSITAMFMMLAFSAQFFFIEKKRVCHIINMVGLLIMAFDWRARVVVSVALIASALLLKYWNNKKKMLRYAIVFFGVIFLIFSATQKLQQWDRESRSNVEFEEYREAFGKIIDKKKIPYAEYATEIKKLGLTENDMEMIWHWYVADKNIYTKDKVVSLYDMQKYTDRYELSVSNLMILMIKTKWHWAIGLVFLCCFLLMKENKKALIGVALCTYAVLGGFIVLQRVIFRMVFPIYIIGIILALYLFAENCKASFTVFLHKKRISICLHVFIILMMVGIGCFGMMCAKESKDINTDLEKVWSAMNNLSEENLSSIYLTNASGASARPLRLWEKEKKSTIHSVLGGWMFHHPYNNAIMKQCGLEAYEETPYLALLQPQVYFVCENEKYTQLLVRYFYEHYKTEVSCEKVETVLHFGVYKFSKNHISK